MDLKPFSKSRQTAFGGGGTIEVAAYNLHPKKMQEIQTPTDFREQVSVFKVDDFRSAARHE
jgi:hypothetical protein